MSCPSLHTAVQAARQRYNFLSQSKSKYPALHVLIFWKLLFWRGQEKKARTILVLEPCMVWIVAGVLGTRHRGAALRCAPPFTPLPYPASTHPCLLVFCCFHFAIPVSVSRHHMPTGGRVDNVCVSLTISRTPGLPASARPHHPVPPLNVQRRTSNVQHRTSYIEQERGPPARPQPWQA